MLTKVDTERSIKRAEKKRKNNKNHWRPTVAVVVTKGKKVLFVLSRKRNEWGLPKGGVEDSDERSLEKAVYRELREEVRLSRDELFGFRYLGTADDQRDKVGLHVGKKMHCAHLKAKRKAKPRANLKENVSKVVWADSLVKFESLQMRPKRRRLWLRALREAGVSWAQ